eukprot:1381744-Rhodomonas_salina.1
MVPCWEPTVTPTRRVSLALAVAAHRTDVSASHSVASHPVPPPTLACCVKLNRPIMPPWIVIETEPVPGAFDRVIALKAASWDTTSDRVPAAIPAVTTARRLLETPPATLHDKEVSDIQLVVSHAESPSRTSALYPDAPMLAPNIVKDPRPELAKLTVAVNGDVTAGAS